MSIKTNRNPTIVRRQGGAMSDDRHHLASGEIGPNLLFGPWSHAPRSGHLKPVWSSVEKSTSGVQNKVCLLTQQATCASKPAGHI